MDNGPHFSEAKRKLLEQMRQAGAGRSLSDSDLNAQARENPLRLSLAQEQVWRLDQTAGNVSPLHNESITIHRRGPCDPETVQRCLEEIVRRHEIWRTTYQEVAGAPTQIVHSTIKFKLDFSDLRSLPESRRETTAIELATQDAKHRFNLDEGPLFRARLTTLKDDEHKLFLTAHQSIVDGITVFDIFPQELTTLYESYAVGGVSQMPELPAQFGDFSSGQSQKLSGRARDEQLAYWQKQLAGPLPILQWPNDGKRPHRQTYRGAIHAFEFPRELAQSLKEVARRQGATLFMVMLGAFFRLLHRYSGQDDIVVGTLSPCGRKQIAFQRCMGYFLNPVALRANIGGNLPLQALLRQMREMTLGAISNDDVTLDMIAEHMGIQVDPSRHPFFTVALSLAPEVAPLPPGWSMTYMDVESGGARWDLYIEFSDRIETLLGRAQYNPDLFTERTIAQTIEDYRQLLEGVAAERDP
ncbi:MAG TPA: condensation domain-containing protein [Candidatus Eisenbacteria bacterium]|nr:condensation domain-containing protein [Candidatus Eisenbacteria bacterium]